MAEVLTVTRSSGVATVTMNRPEVLNSLDETLKDALLAAIAELGADTAVRAVVLTGAGRGFCVGQDLGEHQRLLETGSDGVRDVVTRHFNPIVSGLFALPKPVIAAVNGVAAGAGAGLAFACDFRIASNRAAFLVAFAKIGLSLDTGVSWTLPRLIGSARATALALLAEPVTAEAALEMGLVNAVVEPEQLTAAATELAERLAQGPTAAYAAIKASLAYSATATLAEALEFEADQQGWLGSSADHINATAAFLAKQPTTFVGH